MTNPTTRDLLERALEALEYHTQQTRPIQKTEHAILAIRAELAKPTNADPECTESSVDYWQQRGYLGSPGEWREACRLFRVRCSPEDIQRMAKLRAYIEDGLLTVSRPDNKPPTPAPHDAPIRAYRLTLKLDADTLSDMAGALASAPAWHDAPTCDGLWMCNEGDDNPYRWTTHRVTFPLNQLLVGEDEMWYGPIPQDTKAEGEST